MSEQENLEAKYGRKKTPSQEQNANIDQKPKEEETYNYNESYQNKENNNTYTKKTKQNFTKRQKEIKSSINNFLSQYSYNNYGTNSNYKITENKKDSLFVSFIKGILLLCIILIFACIGISIFAKPYIETEGDEIISQLEKAEKIYFSSVSQYHFFPKTQYDKTLGVDISSCKYFSSYEVRPNEQNNTYAIKLYGATNTFSMSYYYVKAFLKENGILE